MVLTGELPSPLDPPAGCAFHTRCPFARERCQAERPVLRKLGDRRLTGRKTETGVYALEV